MRRGLHIRAKITFNGTFGPHTHTAKITVFMRRLRFQLTTIIFLTTLKKDRVVMCRGFSVSAANCLADLCCPISTSACISFVCKKLKLGCFELFGIFGQVWGCGHLK